MVLPWRARHAEDIKADLVERRKRLEVAKAAGDIVKIDEHETRIDELLDELLLTKQ